MALSTSAIYTGNKTRVRGGGGGGVVIRSRVNVLYRSQR